MPPPRGAARRAAPRSPPRLRRSACSRARSKNLTPLYSGGLCEAEMTTPRSSASRATAGVGRTPASTALPPAATTPRANAASSSGPEPRVSRPTKTRPRRDQSVAALPSRSTSSTVRSSPTTPRTPSVPKYRPQAAELALRELRRLARLVQAGLLALDLACVAREEALALQRDAQLRDRPRRARGRCRGERRRPGRTGRRRARARAGRTCPRAPAVLSGDERGHRGGSGAGSTPRSSAVEPGLAVAGAEDHAGDRRLALAGAEVLRLLVPLLDLQRASAPGPRAGARGRRRS